MTDESRERSVTDADFDALYDLHVASMRDYIAATYGWDDAVQRQMFDAAWPRMPHRRVLTIGAAVVATWVVEQRPTDLYLVIIEIAPAYQSRGLGTRIVGELLDAAKAKGVPAALRVLKANPRARRLYERLGFVATGETPTHVEMATSG